MTVSNTVRVGLIAVAAAATVPFLLSAIDRSEVSNGISLADGSPRSLERQVSRAAASFNEGRFAAAATDAREVLIQRPLDRRALQILSMAEEAQGHLERAADVTIAASAVSRHNPYIEQRLFFATLGSGDIDGAARHADAVTRAGGFKKQGFASLNLLLAQPGGAAALADRLAASPPWRSEYIASQGGGLALMPQQIPAVLNELSRSAAPASSEETGGLLAAMVSRGEGARAWAYWARSHRQPAGAFLDDPDLQSADTAESGETRSPFLWSISSDTPVRFVDRRDPNGRPALHVEVTSDRSPMFVARTIIGSPGLYRLNYQAVGSADQLERLHPEFRCQGRAAIKVAPIPNDRSSPGQTAVLAEVPAGCGAIRLGFTLDSGEGATSSELALRQVSLAKVG